MTKPIIAFAAATLALIGSPALAEPAAPATASVTVDYSDLDLTTPQGAAVLDARVDDAAEKVCARPSIRELKAMRDFTDCAAEARDAAMEQLSVANPFDAIELASAF